MDVTEAHDGRPARRRAQAVRANGLRAVLALCSSARRCWTNTAASTPAATSRTPPTRRAVRRGRAPSAMVLAGGTAHRGGRGGGRGRRAGHALRRLPPEAARVRRRRHAGLGGRPADTVRARFTLGELLPASFGPAHLAGGGAHAMNDAGHRTAAGIGIATMHHGAPAAPAPARPSPPARPARPRPGGPVLLGSGWGGLADLVQTRWTSPMPSCRPSRLGVAGHAGSLRLGTIGGTPRGGAGAAASTPTRPATPTA
jgi:hypothetical protein